MTRGVILAAPSSGGGKTVLALALLRALARGGPVAAAKVGPDYIDPAFHTAAARGPCVNLDGWALRPATLAALAQPDVPLVLCEGVMGLFDGAAVPPGEPDGSTAELAALTGWPVVMVLDVRGMSGSAAAVLDGFVRHRPDVAVAGVIFNRVGGPAHRAMLEAACARAVPACAQLGWVPRDGRLELPSRHLGLVQAGERRDLEDFIERAAGLIAETVDIKALAALARPCRLAAAGPARPLPPLGQTIAVARDEAFAFTYQAVLAGWREAGATLSFFSPLADQAPDPAADSVYLPGGYPELHAGRLAANRRFLDGLREAAGRGAAILGECGGYMVLGRMLRDAEGAPHAMAGLLPLETSFAARRLHLGYRRARLAGACPLGEAGTAFRGHEFHYATVTAEGPAEPLFDTACAAGRPLGRSGSRRGRVMGSFVHLVDLATSF